jgi:hypothetical protein
MSQWKIPSVPELKHESAPPAWLPIIIVLLCIVAGVVFAIIDWKPGTSLPKAFAAKALGVPVLIGTLLSSALFVGWEKWRDRVDWWNHLVKVNYRNWRYWSQWNLAIIDSVILTPEVQLAERMLGLGGTPPENAGLTLTLDGTPADPQRVEAIVEKLVTPLLPHLERLKDREVISVILSASSDVYLKPLFDVLERLKMPGLHAGNLMFVKPDQTAELIAAIINCREWQWENKRRKPPTVCLLVALQLHEDGVEPTFSEAAVSMVLTSMGIAIDYKLKMKARLFQPAMSALEQLPQHLEAMLVAAPTPVDKIRHAWMSGLSVLQRNNVNGTLRDIEREWDQHDLDKGLGKPGPVNAWLMQALAADMVTYGQGPQLLFAPDGDGLMFNLVGKAYSAVEQVPNEEMNSHPVSIVLMVSSALFLTAIVAIWANVGFGWALSIWAFGAFLLFVALPSLQKLVYREIADEFRRVS